MATSASGAIAFTDADLTDTHTVSAVPAAGGYLGDFAVSIVNGSAGGGTGQVTWNFNVANADLQFLAAGQIRTQIYMVTIDDGEGGAVSQAIAVTITGTNDGPTISASDPTGFIEALNASAQNLGQNGTVSFDDIDSNDVVDITFASNGLPVWSHGSLDPALRALLVAGFSTGAIDAAARVRPESYNATANLDFLGADETITFSYTVTATDSAGASASDVMSFMITGTNDGPTVDASDPTGFSEALNTSAQNLGQNGTVSFNDIDSNDVVDITFAPNGSPVWSHGSLDPVLGALLLAGFSTGVIDAAAPGSTPWSYNATANLGFLGAGETITFSYTVTATDGSGATATDVVSFTITGTNEGPTVDASDPTGFSEALNASAQNLNQNGTVSFDDIGSNDVIDITFAPNGSPVWSHGSLDPALGALLLAGFSTGVIDAAAPGSTPWSYNATANLDFLRAGETITFSYTVTATDSSGATATDVASFTIAGTNDGPTITASDPTGFIEAPNASAQNLNQNGTVSFDDIDSNDVVDITFAPNGSPVWSHGSLDPVLGALLLAGFSTGVIDAAAPGSTPWSYNATANLGFLGAGETITFSYTVTATDGSGATATDVVSFTITGTNEGPTVDASDPTGFSEALNASAQNLNQNGTVSFDDIGSNDVIDITFAPNGSPVWSHGSLDPALGALLLAGFSTGVINAAAPGSTPWSYNATANLDFLRAGETITFSYTVTATDSSGATATDVASFTITGTNDGPTITASDPTGFIEAPNASAQNLNQNGTVSFNDIDSNDVIDITFAPNGSPVWSHGSLDPVLGALLLAGFSTGVIDAAAPGSTPWSYNATANLDFLAAGETITFSYTMTATDGSGATATDVVSFTITGTNDGPTVDASNPTGFSEALNASAQNLDQNGTVSFNDIDSNDVVDITFAPNGSPVWSHGSLDPVLGALLLAGFSTGVIDAAAPGSTPWSYNATANLGFLGAGETITFSYTVTATDGSGATATDVVSFTITGTNEGPTVDASDPTGFNEALNASAQNLNQNGTVSFDDIGSNDVIDITFAPNGSPVWSHGSLDPVLGALLLGGFSTGVIDAAAPGSTPWSYNATVNLDFLRAGETITFSYTVTATDSSGATATDVASFTITGTNDGPTITASDPTGFSEAPNASAQNLNQNGTVSFNDIDSNDVVDITFAPNGSPVWSHGSLDPVLGALLLAGFSTGVIDAAAPGSTPWSYNATANLGFLGAGETITFSYTVTATDGSGATATDVVSFTITGTNEGPTVDASDPTGFNEALNASAQNLNQNGTVSFDDIGSNDVIDITFAPNGSPVWSHGSLDPVLGALLLAGFSTGVINAAAPGSTPWSYNATANLDFLRAGETITFSYTVTATDGSGATATDVASFTITGTNDGPTITASDPTGFIEAPNASAQNLNQNGTVSFNDIDSNDVIDITFAPNGSPVWSHGSLDPVLGALLLGGFSTGVIDAAAPGSTPWSYNATVNLDFLRAGETITFSYTMTATDGSGATATDVASFTITGTNDGPTITASDPTGFNEALNASAQNLNQNGTVSFNDIDSNDVVDITFAPNSLPVWSHGSLDPALRALLLAGFSTGVIDAAAPGSTPWSYNATANLDFLGAGETITFSYMVTATDGSGAIATDVVSFTITGTNDPTVLDPNKTMWVASDPARQTPGYERGYELLISAPSDLDVDVLTIAVTHLPSSGQIGYYDGAINFVALAAGQSLTTAQLTSLVYIPTLAIADTPSDTFTYKVNDGSADVIQTIIINEVAPGRLPGIQSQIGSGSSPLTSGNAQQTSFALTPTFASATNLAPGEGTIVIITDFQENPNTDQFDPNEIAGSRVALRDEVEMTLTITESGGGTVSFAIVMDQNANPALNFLNNGVGDWIQSTDTLNGTTRDVWTQTVDYDDVKLISDPSTSLATYLDAINPAQAGDTWTVTYLDDAGGNFQARYAKVGFFFDDPGNPALSVSPVSGSGQPNLIYGTEFGDQLTGGTANDEIIGRGGRDILAGAGGTDTFIYKGVSDSPIGEGNRDVILDFNALNDIIDLSGLPSTLSFGGSNPVLANSVTYFLDVDGNTIIQVDTNGIPAAAEMQIQLNGSHTLSSANFLL